MNPEKNSGRSTDKEWADQYQSEINKQASQRAAQIESLLISGDFNAIREWLDMWEEEDKDPDSLRQKYQVSYAKYKQGMKSDRLKYVID